MGVMADHIQVVAVFVITGVTAFNIVDLSLQLSFLGRIISFHRQHFRVIGGIGSAGDHGTDALRHHGAGGHGIEQQTEDQENCTRNQKPLFMAHDKCTCLLCFFLYCPGGLSGGLCSFGSIPSSLTGVFSGCILLFDGLLLLPAGKGIAGKLGIFLQRLLIQGADIGLFQLTLGLGCFAVGL